MSGKPCLRCLEELPVWCLGISWKSMSIHGVQSGGEFGYNEVGKRRLYLAGKWKLVTWKPRIVVVRDEIGTQEERCWKLMK